MSTTVRLPTPQEERQIRDGIAADPENPELHEADFASMRPAEVALPAVVADHIRPARGPQRAPTKELISLRLDRDVLEALRATGEGWQRRVGEILRKALLAR